MTERAWTVRLREAAARPVDVASLAVFRIGFGALLFVASVRYFVRGWIEKDFVAPAHFFHYYGFDWVRPLPGPLMYGYFGLLAALAACIALGLFTRWALAAFALLFAYQHLLDATHYLNHYYLLVCVCGLSACLPLHAAWSLDARRRPELARSSVPAWALWALRLQFGLVYFFGGLAKLRHDWLLDAQPLGIWLSANRDFPLLGRGFDWPWVPYVFSWAGAAFDLGIVPLLLWRRSRPFALALVAAFHLTTAELFPIGMFPYVMMWGALLFCEPNWPRRLASVFRRSRSAPPGPSESSSRADALPAPALAALLGAYFLLQFSLPLRQFLYPGNVLWTEQGFRFSWSVMLMEKNGSIDFRVVDPDTGRRYRASPLDYYSAYQVRMMAPQPDLVLQAAHVVARDFRLRGVAHPRVYADAFVSLNGRPAERFIDPERDLAAEREGFANKDWILPAPSERAPAPAPLAWSAP